MNIVIFSHPDFIGSQSMPRYTQWLADGMLKRGNTVEIWQPQAFFYKIPFPKALKKWLGYLDQYLLFPVLIQLRLFKQSKETLYVFSDHALGPWIPLVAHKPHVVHCHDFLAQASAIGEIPENPTGFTGRCYQAFIRKGYRKAKNFISISQKTQEDLHRFLIFQPENSTVIYNGLTREHFPEKDQIRSRRALSDELDLPLESGFILHVGGNQWYKNRAGVVKIYESWRTISAFSLPLVMVGRQPNRLLENTISCSDFKDDIYCLTNASDQTVRKLYASASVFLFPSLAEGFGWPIIEAMASGCPVITTNERPMNEVGNGASLYIERLQNSDYEKWCQTGADKLEEVLRMKTEELSIFKKKSIENSKRFDSDNALNKIEAFYGAILGQYNGKQNIRK